MPDEFHDLQPQLLSRTLALKHYTKEQWFTGADLNLYYDLHYPLWYKRPDWFLAVGVPRLYDGHDLRRSYVTWQIGLGSFGGVPGHGAKRMHLAVNRHQASAAGASSGTTRQRISSSTGTARGKKAVGYRDVVEQDKMQEYLDNGAVLGWLVDRKHRTVHIYRLGQAPEILENPEEVSGDPELPGFSMPMAKVW